MIINTHTHTHTHTLTGSHATAKAGPDLIIFLPGLDRQFAGKSLNAGRKEAEPVRRHVAQEETDAGILPVGHDLMVMHRLIEKG